MSQVIYPDPKLTPGVFLLHATAKEVCVPGYAQHLRNVPASVKHQVFARYGLTTVNPVDYEVDHFCPLELAGANCLQNLWPQPRAGQWGAAKKDHLENVLHQMVCAGKLALAEAQRDIMADWVAAYKKHVGPA